MFGFYERTVLEDGREVVHRLRLLANPEDVAHYEAKGYRYLGPDREPASPDLTQRVAALEAAAAKAGKAKG